jgi:hypothetical protein
MSEDGNLVILIGGGIVVLATIWALWGWDLIPTWSKILLVGGEIYTIGKSL